MASWYFSKRVSPTPLWSGKIQVQNCTQGAPQHELDKKSETNQLWNSHWWVNPSIHTLKRHLSQWGNDTFVWRWTRSGEYSATFAYEIQFLGASAMFKAPAVWKVNTEPKCRFFTWLGLLQKIPTADNLMRKGWPCDPNCSLCFCIPETG
jgi:hypothetical protein